MSARKIILRVGLGLLVLIVLLVLLGWLMIDSLAEKAVETGAGYALGVETRVDSMNVSLLAGSVTMKDMTVANPEGFDSEHLFHMGNFDLYMRLYHQFCT